MTREEAIKELKEMIKYEWGTYQTKTARIHVNALDMAIKALEQESTTKNDLGVDCISRKAVLDELEKWDWQELYLPIHFKENIIDVLPSVYPKSDKPSGKCKDCGYYEKCTNLCTKHDNEKVFRNPDWYCADFVMVEEQGENT